MTDIVDLSPQLPISTSYLGDGLYVEYDGYHVCLYASNGIQKTNEVFLEPTVLEAFTRWIRENGLVRSS